MHDRSTLWFPWQLRRPICPLACQSDGVTLSMRTARTTVTQGRQVLAPVLVDQLQSLSADEVAVLRCCTSWLHLRPSAGGVVDGRAEPVPRVGDFGRDGYVEHRDFRGVNLDQLVDPHQHPRRVAQ